MLNKQQKYRDTDISVQSLDLNNSEFRNSMHACMRTIQYNSLSNISQCEHIFTNAEDIHFFLHASILEAWDQRILEKKGHFEITRP